MNLQRAMYTCLTLSIILVWGCLIVQRALPHATQGNLENILVGAILVVSSLSIVLSALHLRKKQERGEL